MVHDTDYVPRCVICGKVLTWDFYVCSSDEDEYGRRVEDRPDWLTYLINEERMVRYHIKNNGGRVIRIEDSDDGFSYRIGFDELIEYKIYYSGWMAKTSDGEMIELKDSDWDSVFTYSF